MATTGDWRTTLSSLNRYESIQEIRSILEGSTSAGSQVQKEAFALENELYKSSSSLDEYKAACKNIRHTVAITSEEQATTAAQPVPESPGITVGPYQNCHYVASGVTAEVYRCKTKALKVITETRNIEPHNPFREANILGLLKKPCIPLLETFRDQEQRFVLVFPYMPLTLEAVLAKGSPIPRRRLQSYFRDCFVGLNEIHGKGVIHRDVKPSAVLLESPDGPAYISDFGTAWQQHLSTIPEPPSQKILDIGTGPYRAPEVLFGDRSYSYAVDLWAAGAMLVECCRDPPTRPLFESRPVHEDGNQLGLILSIFKTIGSPTKESWPEAARFRTPPFEMYATFKGQTWDEVLVGIEPDFQDLVKALVIYDSKRRATAVEALQFPCLAAPEASG